MNNDTYHPFLRTAVSTNSSGSSGSSSGTNGSVTTETSSSGGGGGGDNSSGRDSALIVGVLAAVVLLYLMPALYQWGRCCYACFQFERGRYLYGAAAEVFYGADRRRRHPPRPRDDNTGSGTGDATLEGEAELRLRVLQWLPSVQMVLADENFSPPENSSALGEGDRPDDDQGSPSDSRRAPGTNNDGRILIPAPGLLSSAPLGEGVAEATSVHGVDDDDDICGGGKSGEPPSSPHPADRPSHPDIAGLMQPRDGLLPWGRPMRWAAGTCTICLGSYQVGQSVTWSSNPECEHCFHTSCIEKWVLRKRPPKNHRIRRPNRGNEDEDDDGSGSVPLCPNCRRPLVVRPFEVRGVGVQGAGPGSPVVPRLLIDSGGHNATATATAAAAVTVDPFEGTSVSTSAVSSGADPPAPSDVGGGGGASSGVDCQCQSIDV